jgi:hypothetical protein
MEHTMTTAEKAKAIVNLARNYERDIRENAKYARAAHAGVEASHDCWEQDPNQDSFNTNPYRLDPANAALDKAEKLEADATEILKFVTDHFLGMLQ